MGFGRTPPDDHEDAAAVVQWAGLAAGQIAPDLADVSETMLWALHNRATEAGRRDGMRWTPSAGQVAKRESPLGTAGWPKVRHGEYTEET
jgi:hypothetical protein